MEDIALQTVYHSVVIAKLTYASSAWWGFASAADWQRLEAFIRWSHRCHFVPPNLPSFTELCSTADNELFQCVINNSKHVLYGLLPPTSVAIIYGIGNIVYSSLPKLTTSWTVTLFNTCST